MKKKRAAPPRRPPEAAPATQRNPRTRAAEPAAAPRSTDPPPARRAERAERPAPSARGRGTGGREFAPWRSEELPRFAGVPTFLRLPEIPPEGSSAVDVVLVGAPFDGGTSFRPGARLGPRAVREASALARRFSPALGIDIFDELAVADAGDVRVNPHQLDEALEAIAVRAEAIARSGVIGGWVGGDQTITLGVLRGLQRAKLRSVGLLHIDAHDNAAGPAWGSRIHHGSVIRVAVEEGLVRPEHTLQVGLRGPWSSGDELDFSLKQGFEVVDVDEVRWDLHAAIRAVRKLVRTGPIYVSVDVTALDPAFAPGVSLPLPGGMTTWELQQLLRALVGADIVGFDVVEIAPPYDPIGLTALVGVTAIQEVLAAIADTRRSARPAPSTQGDAPRRGRRLSP
ncbi:MAG: arginase family protein [Polyangiaceae bacterium]|nr:arginase family protein [Polyangiaceae bacterium]